MATLTLAFKGKTLQVFPLFDGLVTIGRDDGCDIHIDSLAVEPQHARLMVRDNSVMLSQGKHDNTTYLNHKPIAEQTLQHNDMLRIGKHILTFRDDDIDTKKIEPQTNHIASHSTATVPTVAANTEMPKVNNSGWLQVMNGKRLGQTFKLRAGLTDLGKLGMLPALIALRSNGYFISNLADTDTLSVANQEIGNTSHPLHDGDLIKLGKLTLQFHLYS